MKQSEQSLPLPDKKIPTSIMVIGTFEIAVSLLGLILVVLVGRLNGFTLAYLIMLLVYGALGAGLWAIQEWARFVNIVLHSLWIPFVVITFILGQWDVLWPPFVQVTIAGLIIYYLSRPEIRFKFQTVVPKQKSGH
ncbi:MAG: hypothetical protein R3264_19040 [Anaerolineae bacterium]|nr:hypothetical protein [Anaerolineae bacterium]